MKAVSYILIALLIWNIAVMFLYAADKRRARKHKRRIPEKTLLLCAFLGGGVGALAGMLLFRHKTKHTRFIIMVPVACLVTGLIVWALLRGIS